jgi:hypothetical protein
MDRIASTGDEMPSPVAVHKILLPLRVVYFSNVAGLQQNQA